ncbi:sensor histidine kinase [Haloferula helveola]|uniref:histidine kinase n=1 Tax=Haloferula helveola TaxID=490095 RepID=A0ABN6H0Y3_9BACT|nr:sensor histidine kinase [Haloferula helveola]
MWRRIPLVSGGLAGVWALCLPLSGLAWEPATTTTPFELRCEVRSWTVADGLPHPRVKSLCQLPDGRLLVGTQNGLARYDGSTMASIEGPLRPDQIPRVWNVSRVHRTSSDEVLVVGPTRPFSVLDGDTFQPLDGGPAGWMAMCEDREGVLWTVAGNSATIGVFERRDGTFRKTSEFNSYAVPHDLRLTDDGRIWGILKLKPLEGNTNLFELIDGVVTPRLVPAEAGQGLEFFVTKEGKLHLMGSRGIYAYEDGAWSSVRQFPGGVTFTGDRTVSNAVEDLHGDLWIGTTGEGLWVWERDSAPAKVVIPGRQLSRLVSDLLIDRSGSIWVGTDAGLFQFYRPPFVRWPAWEVHRSSPVGAMAEDGTGTMWFTSNEDVFHLRPGQFAEVALGAVAVRRTHVIGCDAGAIVVGWGGPFWMQTEQEMSHFAPHPFAPERLGYIESVAATRDVLWAVSGSLLSRFEQGEWVLDHPNGDKNLAAEPAVAATDDGELIASFRPGGFFRRSASGEWVPLGRPEGNEILQTVAFDPNGGFWARAGATTLGRYSDGTWKVFEPQGFELPARFDMVDDGKRWLWFYGPGTGVLRLDRDAVLKHLDGETDVAIESRMFGVEDGLSTTASFNLGHSMIEARDGRIWVTTSAGVCAMDPAVWEAECQRSTPPSIVLTGAFVDDESRMEQLRGGQEISIAADARRLQVDYQGIDLVAPERVGYRYRLVGYDDGWVSAGNRRQAIYQDLPAGSYTFEVVATGREGAASPEPVGLAVLVEPAWWERPAARAAAVLLVLAAIALAFALRERAVRARESRREAYSRQLIATQEEERARIAGELHDSLGQEMLVLKGRLELAAIKHPDAEETLEELSGEISETIEHARALSHDLRPPRLERFGLSKALEALGEDLRSGAKFEVVTRVDELNPRLPGELEIGLYRIAQEAVANVIKHAEASQVGITLHRAGSGVVLEIRDNGRGFDPATATQRPGLGVNGMGERARLFGGVFRCESKPGGGTLVTVTVKSPGSGRL